MTTSGSEGGLVFAAVLPLMDRAADLLAELSVVCESIGLDRRGAAQVRRQIGAALHALQQAQDLAGSL